MAVDLDPKRDMHIPFICNHHEISVIALGRPLDRIFSTRGLFEIIHALGSLKMHRLIRPTAPPLTIQDVLINDNSRMDRRGTWKNG